MHRPIFGHSFAVLVAPVLLSVLAFSFLNKKKTSVRKNEEDADTGGSGSVTAPTGTNSGGSSSSPKETTNGSSSSSTATTTGNSYDIFLSFRGPDTRNGFAGHLYNRLCFAKTHPFRDDVELRQGEKIGPDLLAAIKNSKILIPILSENYGTSSWCLDELAQIMKCKKNNPETIVLPIFYKVAPADVRHQIGKFGEAFCGHNTRLRKRNFDPTILKKWEDALKEVGGLKGREVTGSEAAVIDSVLDQVLLELKKKFELDIPENLIGIDSHVKKLMEVVNNNSSATLFFVIHGMGGIGKTTLAKKFYNELSNRFKYRCFIPDVRKSCEGDGIEHLQNKLISVTLEQDYKVSTRDEGIRFLSSNINGKKVLFLLDDVYEDHDVKALAGNRSWFSLGSIIIITTRNMSIIDKARGDYPYELEGMGRNNSTILFSRHAFLRDSPPSEFKELTDKVVSTTGGLPLALEVLGSFLLGAKQETWTRTIKKLQKIPDEGVQEKLKISYNALSPGEKQIFLDIACFFIGTDERIASYMWDACNFFAVGIEVLRLRSLIKVGNDHELIMHDQVRDLGRWIVCEGNENKPQCCSRLWNSEEALKVLKEKEGTKEIEAISCSKFPSHQDDNILNGEQFKKLKNLRFLDASWAHLIGDFKNSTKNLKWLRWWNCPSTFEANNFDAKELVVLDLSASKLSDTWPGWSSIKVAKKLKYLDLTNCESLEKTSFLSYFENLEVLILRDCRNLKQIDSSIGKMKSMVRLDLTGCVELKRLPAEVGKLEALEQLILEESGIEELPESICNISSLQRLNFGHCQNLQSLPTLPSNLTFLHVTCRSRRLPSLSNLTHLKEVRILDCEFLECIWEQPSTLLERCLHAPFELEILAIRCCELMKTLDVLQFHHLRTLSVQSCENILEIRGLDELLYLESFVISSCPSIKRLDLPKSKSLKQLKVEYCENLVEIQGLDALESLQEIELSLCSSIERLNFSKSKGLKIFKVIECRSLVEIQDLDTLESLEEIGIFACSSIERLDLPKFRCLNTFKATHCESLVEIQGLDALESLKEIDICVCVSIERLNLSKSKGLKIFKATYCKSLVEIQGLDALESLKEIDISWCPSIERLNLSKSKGLKIFKATYCKSLVEIQGLDMLESLKEIDICKCASIERLDLSKSKGLKIFKARDCKSLVEIQGLDALESLKEIDISVCASIERLNLSKSKGLKIFKVTDCKSLIEIQALDALESLEEIDISECASIERLNLSKSKGLKIFNATDCKSLVEIQGLDTLESLKEIDISECASIERLNLSKSKGLKMFKATYCKSLVEIQGLNTLESLEEIDISECASIERLNLPKSEGLKIFQTTLCKSLIEIQGLDKLESLEEVRITRCHSIQSLNLPKSKGLKIFKATYCDSLVEIQGLDMLESLEEIDIFQCASIERLDLSKSKVLKKLSIRSCKKLFEIQGLDGLEFLNVLNLSRCTSFGRLPNICCFDTLHELAINCCDNLHDIQGLVRFPSCKRLWIEDCNSLANFPNLSNFRKLKKLFLSNCHGFREIPWLVESTSLFYIAISGCSSVEILPDLSSCTNLTTLVVQNCEKLTELRGLEKLEHLSILDISGCKSLKTIPELPGIPLFRIYEGNPFGSFRLMMEFGEDYSDESEC